MKQGYEKRYDTRYKIRYGTDLTKKHLQNIFENARLMEQVVITRATSAWDRPQTHCWELLLPAVVPFESESDSRADPRRCNNSKSCKCCDARAPLNCCWRSRRLPRSAESKGSFSGSQACSCAMCVATRAHPRLVALSSQSEALAAEPSRRIHEIAP